MFGPDKRPLVLPNPLSLVGKFGLETANTHIQFFHGKLLEFVKSKTMLGTNRPFNLLALTVARTARRKVCD